MSIERLTAEELLMLWPDETWPQDIGALAVLDGRNLLDLDGRFRIEAVREAVAARLHLVPRFRQLVYAPPRRLGRPLWVDDPGFDLNEHVGVMPLQAPGDEAQLLLATEKLRRRRLDRSRPLWEMWFLPGLPERRVGLFMRTHHAIADGMAGVTTFGTFLDVDPLRIATLAQPWTATPWPTERELLADTRRRHLRDAVRALSAVAHPVKSVRQVVGAWPAIRELVAGEELPATSLDRVVGPDRNLTLIRSRLDLVKEVAHTYDAKVNDVLLAAIAGGLRRLLSSRGEPVEGLLRVYVPVSLRHGQYAGARGNLIAEMVVSLPVGVADPVRRLHQIAAETAQRKLRSRPSLGKLPHGRLMGRAFLRLVDRLHVNVTTADLPGPPIRLYFAGAPVLEVFPLLPLIERVSLGVGALSYAGQFNITAVADRDGYPDIEVFAAGVREELHALGIETPWSPTATVEIPPITTTCSSARGA
ncbi:MAG TPA: wax ester/triacylglycerol synthase family O-acyltransferase, partial [Candidatus Sulfotelmatobacter sp.]|nr:wax ester/triacylglycerol synthase family O-acyltransferase [Candidatus Sulfotelmatobacter sp.]